MESRLWGWFKREEEDSLLLLPFVLAMAMAGFYVSNSYQNALKTIAKAHKIVNNKL